jgi:hypothetical protein
MNFASKLYSSAEYRQKCGVLLACNITYRVPQKHVHKKLDFYYEIGIK